MFCVNFAKKNVRSAGNVRGVQTANYRDAGFLIMIVTTERLLHVMFLIMNIDVNFLLMGCPLASELKLLI